MEHFLFCVGLLRFLQRTNCHTYLWGSTNCHTTYWVYFWGRVDAFALSLFLFSPWGWVLDEVGWNRGSEGSTYRSNPIRAPHSPLLYLVTTFPGRVFPVSSLVSGAVLLYLVPCPFSRRVLSKARALLLFLWVPLSGGREHTHRGCLITKQQKTRF